MPKKHNNLWLPYTQMKNVFSPVKAVKTKGSLIYLDNNKCKDIKGKLFKFSWKSKRGRQF